MIRIIWFWICEILGIKCRRSVREGIPELGSIDSNTKVKDICPRTCQNCIYATKLKEDAGGTSDEKISLIGYFGNC